MIMYTAQELWDRVSELSIDFGKNSEEIDRLFDILKTMPGNPELEKNFTSAGYRQIIELYPVNQITSIAFLGEGQELPALDTEYVFASVDYIGPKITQYNTAIHRMQELIPGLRFTFSRHIIGLRSKPFLIAFSAGLNTLFIAEESRKDE